ncbi:cupin domain-containing protein [Thiomicrorhabdus chilensis]|uniref:cupin domain-containing protein n=1 Tax=Thiomicrorhabdus chilensis TaxID=63656 RepID=UPI00048AE3C7|nr:cupin domain-containing protein [Thiomicrorhabdus chilensis]
MQITIESHPAQSYLDTLAVNNWPIWEKEVSEFPWFYEMEEVCLILQGEVIVTPEKGQPVRIKAGDLVTFPKGMHCRWHITQDIRKHYLFR